MKKTFAFLFLTAALALPLQAQADMHERTAGENPPPAAVAPAPETLPGFTLRERVAIYDYFELSPFQRNVREDIRSRIHAGPDALVGSRLSPGVPRNDVPVRLERKLNPPKAGTKHVAIDADLVLLDLGTLQIIDVVPNVIPQYTR